MTALARLADRLATLPPAPLFGLLLAVALLHRAPGLLFHDLNMDEELYRLMAASLLEGHAPYRAVWDRKPVGTFVLLAMQEAVLGGSLAAFRLATNAAVALAAWLLALAARRLFPGLPGIGPAAGLLLIAFSVANGGQGMNTELLFVPLGLAGLLLLFRAWDAPRHVFATALLAGLCYGAAVQVKQFALFDLAGHALLLLVVRCHRPATDAAPARLARLVPGVGIGLVLPTLAVLAWYAAIGALGLWHEANIAAALPVMAGEEGLNWAGLRAGLIGFDLLVLGTLATLLAAPWLARDAATRRALLGLLLWLGLLALPLALTRRFADHFFLQPLPVLALLTAAGAALALRRAAGWRPGLARLGGPALLLLAALGLARVGLGQVATAAEVLWQRHVAGQPHWGDRSATLAAAMRPRIAGPGDLYVVSRLLGLHRLTGTRPPTRFPFTLHLLAGYAPVDGPAEMARILGTAPRFIVVETRWLETRPARLPAAAPVLDLLEATLARDYVTDGEVGLFQGRRGIIGGAVDARVFRRRDVAPPDLPAGLHYRAPP